MTSSQRISRDEVAHVAHLARLNVTDDELDRYTAQLGDVLDHAADLEALDLSDVEVSWRPYPLRNVLRPDTVVPPVDREEVLGQAPAAEEGQFRVPPVLGEEP